MTRERLPTLLSDRPMPYCKGCGHGVVSRRLNDALVRLKLEPSQVVITSDIGCVGLVDPLFPSVHTVHTIHGRSTAVAAGAVLADAVLGDGRMKNVVMIGDGGATIGLLHLSQAALLNVDMTVLLHNNMLYGMTGGQHSALTPEGFVTSTTPAGNWVPAVDMEHFLRGCQAAYFARKLATDADLCDVIAEAIAFPGFALVEVLELCTGFGVPLNAMDGKSLRTMAEARGHGLGVLIRRDDREPYHAVYRKHFPVRENEPAQRQSRGEIGELFSSRLQDPMTVVVAGSAGERVQSAAALVTRAAMLSGLHCVQKNDYPVTVGSGFSIAEIKLSREPILYTGADTIDALLIVSADGLAEARKRGDIERLSANGWLIADESLSDELSSERLTRTPLRRVLGSDAAALGALALLFEKSGTLERAALSAAAELSGSKGALALSRALGVLETLV